MKPIVEVNSSSVVLLSESYFGNIQNLQARVKVGDRNELGDRSRNVINRIALTCVCLSCSMMIFILLFRLFQLKTRNALTPMISKQSKSYFFRYILLFLSFFAAIALGLPASLYFILLFWVSQDGNFVFFYVPPVIHYYLCYMGPMLMNMM